MPRCRTRMMHRKQSSTQICSHSILSIPVKSFTASMCVAENAEKDAFFCFVNLMADIRDHFCESLDHSDSGIKGSLSQMMRILQRCDHELWSNLVCPPPHDAMIKMRVNEAQCLNFLLLCAEREEYQPTVLWAPLALLVTLSRVRPTRLGPHTPTHKSTMHWKFTPPLAIPCDSCCAFKNCHTSQH